MHVRQREGGQGKLSRICVADRQLLLFWNILPEYNTANSIGNTALHVGADALAC